MIPSREKLKRLASSKPQIRKMGEAIEIRYQRRNGHYITYIIYEITLLRDIILLSCVT